MVEEAYDSPHDHAAPEVFATPGFLVSSVHLIVFLPSYGKRPEVMMSEGKSIKPSVYLFVTLMGLWLLWSGHYTPLMISFGVFCSLGVVLLCRRLGLVDNETLPLHKTPSLLRYAPWLLWEIVKSNFDVARRILSPSLPISPRILTVKTSQKSDLFRVTYAHSITLTPGTLTIDADGDELKVHAIAEDHAKGLEEGEMDRRVTRFEGAP